MSLSPEAVEELAAYVSTSQTQQVSTTFEVIWDSVPALTSEFVSLWPVSNLPRRIPQATERLTES